MTNNNQKPILFSTAKIRGIIEYLRHNPDAEIQTRRVINPQPSMPNMQLTTILDTTGDRRKVGKHQWTLVNGNGYEIDAEDNTYFSCPYKVGDTLWVRETWAIDPAYDELSPSQLLSPIPSKYIRYRATNKTNTYWGRWRPSIHMPRWAAIRSATVTAVRAQRLQSITEEDAIAECIQSEKVNEFGDTLYGLNLNEADAIYSDCPIGAFRELWNQLNAKSKKRDYPWDANPWVWAYTLKPTEGWQQ